MMPARVALALQADGWVLRSDIIWCLSGGTRVYARTQKGDMPTTLKDIARLRPDTVQLWNGERWTQLLGMSETPRETAIEILLRSGERISCTPHHEWPTQRGLVRADALQTGDVLQTTRLPEPTSAKLPAALSDEMVGWFVGLYLAEGSKDSKSLHIAGHVKETDRYAHCQRIAEAFQGSCTWRNTVGLGATITLHGKIIRAIVETYIAGNSSADKRLTNACWQRSDVFLRALLDGYLHGDGHYDAANDRWRLHFRRNYTLEADFRTLCARLGISLRLHLSHATLNGRAFPSHRGELRFSKSAHHNVKRDAEVMALGRSRGRKFWHLGVADAPHLFALSSGVLTSNSKPNPMPESVTDRPTKAHEYLFLLSKRAEYYYDAEAVREPHSTNTVFTYPQPDKAARAGVTTNGTGASSLRLENPAGRNRRSVWTIPTESYAAAHFATFPRKLVEPCILAGTSARGQCPACGAPWRRETAERNGRGSYHDHGADQEQGMSQPQPNSLRGADFYANWEPPQTTGWTPTCRCDAGPPCPQTVLDPFLGSGTTAYIARHHGRRAVGIELNEEYSKLAADRLKQGSLGLELW